MVERLVITAMGKQRLRERIEDSVLTALKNLSLNASDEHRAMHVVSAIMICGEYTEHPDHGTWHEKTSHQ